MLLRSKTKSSVGSPAHASRIPIFAPTRRPTARKEFKVETPWGAATITGRLGQQHRDWLDAARLVAERQESTADGRLHLLIDPAKLRVALGGMSYRQVDEIRRDLQTALIEMHIKSSDVTISGALLAEVVNSPAAGVPATRPGAKAEGRRYWRVSFGLAWSKLIENDLVTFIPLAQIVGMRYGISQAVARYCLTHKAVCEPLAGIAKRLGATRELCKIRAELLAESAKLADVGVGFDGDRVTKL